MTDYCSILFSVIKVPMLYKKKSSFSYIHPECISITFVSHAMSSFLFRSFAIMETVGEGSDIVHEHITLLLFSDLFHLMYWWINKGVADNTNLILFSSLATGL